MKTCNRSGMLAALATCALIVSIGGVWFGSRAAAHSRQDPISQNQARGGLEVREAADEAGFGPLGVTRGQTLRIELDIDLLNPPGANQGQFDLTVYGRAGNVLAQRAFAGNINAPNSIHSFDLNADQLPQTQFDNAGRAEIFAVLQPSGGPQSARLFFSTAQVFDNTTGKTTALIPGALLGCCTGRH